MSTDTDRWFETLPAEQQAPARILRDLVLASDPDIREELKWRQPCYAINAMVCYIQKARGHLSIGFRQGLRLNDPDALLQGAGAQMRHVKISNGDPIAKPAIQALIAQAVKLDREAQG